MDQNYEPMDIDLSAHSNSAMDISYNSSSATDIDAYLEADDFDLPIPPAQTFTTSEPELPPSSSSSSNVPQSTHIKTFNIKMQKLKKPYMSLKFKAMCSVVILILSFISYQVLNIQCSTDMNLDELNKSLSIKLFGQHQAISSLIEALSVSERSKILFLYGGIGVGKTLTASLILQNIGSYSNVYHYIMPSFMDTFATDFMIGLSVCKHTIIIIDDLSAKDFDVKAHIENVIEKSQNLGKDITVILIFNCDNATSDFQRQCDKSFSDKLLQHFSDVNAFKKFIKFEPLKEEHLKQCIETELGSKSLSNMEFQKLLKNFNVSLDGCKGVYKKIKMMDIL